MPPELQFTTSCTEAETVVLSFSGIEQQVLNIASHSQDSRSLKVILTFTVIFLSLLTIVLLAFSVHFMSSKKKLPALASKLSGFVYENFWFRLCLSLLTIMLVLSFTVITIYFVSSCQLSLMACGVFLHLSFLFKFAIMGLAVILYSLLIHIIYSTPFTQYDLHQCGHSGCDGFLGLQTRATIYLLILFITLHLLDRQLEFAYRLDFLWKQKSQREMGQVEMMGSLSKTLLENVLPRHVADHYLRTISKSEALYHESYSCVAVMFASIPSFKDFYQQNTANKQGLECLRVLNEIIAAFDMLLARPGFKCVEKIKTVGSTYMAAAGLHPGGEDDQDFLMNEQHVVTMAEFAFTMIDTLDELNRDTFNQFKLRVGIYHGPVIAGVIGPCKPQFDIWGDTVNVASRMDSCGQPGKLQVPERTAVILINAGYSYHCRGEIQVKGKDPMITHFIYPKWMDQSESL